MRRSGNWLSLSLLPLLPTTRTTTSLPRAATATRLRQPLPLPRTLSRAMSNAPSPSPSPASQRPPSSPIFFGPFEVTSQVFLTTPHTFALVNLKPLLPGHVLVCPFHPHQRLTSLSPLELTDLFSTVQRVQRMLARHYFPFPGGLDAGAFNIALQDGPEAGQTVPHVHVHVIPRIRGATAKGADTPSDELYERMAGEEGNVGGWLWDAARGRPGPAGGEFPRIEDAERRARSMGEMEEEAAVFRGVLRGLEAEEGEGR